LYYILEMPVVNPSITTNNPGLVGETVFVTLFNERRVEGRVTAMLNTVAGITYRVICGDLLFQVSLERICEGRRNAEGLR